MLSEEGCGGGGVTVVGDGGGAELSTLFML